MPLRFNNLKAAAFALSLGVASFVQAQDAPDPNRVLATVNGTEITLAHVIAVRAELPQQYDQLPAALLFDGILNQLIQQTLLMQSFDAELSLQSRIMIENERRAVIAGEAISGILSEGVAEAALVEAYNQQYPEVAEELEYRASHILLETEEEAAALKEEIEGGAQFAAMAREHSTGPSASVGGDLGWFGDGDIVPEFFEAVVALDAGGVSEPVKTDFGWHLINLVETRAKERPEFETVRPELEDQLQQNLLQERIEALTAEAAVDRAETDDLDPESINRFDLLEE